MSNISNPDSDTIESAVSNPALGTCPLCGLATLIERADYAIWCTNDNKFITPEQVNLVGKISE